MRSSMFIVAMASLTAAASAGVVKLETTAYSFNPGGEFKVTPISGDAGLVGLPADLSADTFETFCLEASEQYRPGNNYNFTINVGAVQGGQSGQTVPGFDPLDARTAYLYFNFRMGTLSGFDYSAAGRAASAEALQKAIWYIEGETGVNNAFVALADAAVSGGQWVGIGNVRVLNLSDSEFPNAQDQLTIIRDIPTPGAGVLALVGLIAASRRRR